jgi:hypothetical protein
LPKHPVRGHLFGMSETNIFQQPAGPQAAGQAVAANPNVAGETADQALVRAQAAAQAKRMNEASGICADVLAASPDHPAALALLGIIAAMVGDAEKGIVLMRRAIQLRPGNATWYGQNTNGPDH